MSELMVEKKQNVPEGYKLTEAGVIPEDWEVKSYGDVFTYLSTSTNSRADLSTRGDYGYVHYGDIHTKWNNKLDLNRVELPQVSKSLVSSAFVEEGDVIMADASEDYEGIGKSVEVSNVGVRKVVAGLHTFLLRDKDKRLSDGFRGYLHSIPVVKVSLDKMATGLKVYGISKKNLASILIPIPTKKEQTAISTALSDVDELLTSLEALIAKKQAIKTATMQQLLTGRTRLPQFALREDGSPKGYKQSELGEIPEDWELVPLGDLLAYEQPTKYLVSHSRALEQGAYPVLTAGKSFVLGYTEEKEGVYIDLPVIIFDDFTTDSKYVDFPFKAKSSAMKMLKAKSNEIPFRLIFNLLSDVDYQIGDHKRHWISEFQYISVALSSDVEEKIAIATILSDMDAEIEALERQLNKTRQIKQGMMQQLLTGKIRLVTPK